MDINQDFEVPHKNSTPVCKIKYNTWEEYQILGNMPTTFNDLIKILSGIFYPKNFSISFISENYKVISIDNSNTYKSLLKYAKESGINEIKLSTILYDNQKGEEKLLTEFNDECSYKPVQIRQKIVRNSPNSFNLCQTIKESEESNSSSVLSEKNSFDSDCSRKSKKYHSRNIRYNTKKIRKISKSENSENSGSDCITCY